ncbi:MAG: hypothetical protein OXG79_05975 [Chloroflexi bacterium]|nr:hypothetical protein [Chloroflexota bacterium]
MHFSIDAETRGGLRVIPTIPNIDRCWLEGRNGIGKTVAVRLLELVAGRQPFRSDLDAWVALKENLGPTTIVISEFPSTAKIESIRIELTPDKWPADPIPLTEDLGSVFIDGNQRDHQALRELFDLVRIGGDETVVSQLSNLIGDDYALAARSRQWLENIAKDAESILTPLIIDIDRLSESDFEAADDAVQITTKELIDIDSKVEKASGRRLDLEELITLSELRQQQARLGPEIRVKLDAAKSRVRKLTEAKEELAEELRGLVPNHAALQQLQRELEELQSQRDGRRSRAARTHWRAQQAMQAVGATAGTVSSMYQRALVGRNKLRRDRAALASLPDMLDLIGDARAPLAVVEGSSLDDEILAVVDTNVRVTTSDLRAGLDARSDELERDVSYEQLARIDEQIATSESRIRVLSNVCEALRDADRKATLLLEVEREIEAKEDQIRGSSGDKYSEMSERLRAVELQITSEIQREAELRVHLDLLNRSGGASTLDSKVADLEQRLEIAASGAQEALNDTVALRQDRVAEQQRLRDELSLKKALRRELEDQLVRALRLIARGADYQWLRESVPAGTIPTLKADRTDALRRLVRLADAARRVQSDVDASLNQVAAVEAALDDIKRSIVVRGYPSRARYAESLVKWYEGQMADYLSNQDIREAIFDGGDFQRFDLVNGFVSWRTKTGEQRRRPIEAFSSGERAFAYMLAAILSHGTSAAHYRVFVLDEFGAFVEQSRRSRLWHFLDQRLLKEGLAAQVVVILPSQASPPATLNGELFTAEDYFARDAGP